MNLAAATARFNARAFATRRASHPVTVTVKGQTGTFKIAKGATGQTRERNEQGTGWTLRTHATFTFPGDGELTPTIGGEFTITVSADPAEVGTTWRCFDLRAGNPTTAASHRCVCFRLD